MMRYSQFRRTTMSLLAKTPIVKSFVSQPQPRPQPPEQISLTDRIIRNRTMSNNAGPKKTIQMLGPLVQGAKRYFSLDDPLRLKKYFSDYHLKAFAAAQRFALILVDQSRLVSIEDFKEYAETVTALVQAYKDTSQFRAALIEFFKKKEEEPKKEEEEEEPKPEGFSWYQLASSKPDRLKYLVPVFGVTKSAYISGALTEVEDKSILLVKAYATEGGKLREIQVEVELPPEFNFKQAEVYKKSLDKEDGVVLLYIRGYTTK